MTPQSEQILREALDLPPIDRAELVEQILANFEFRVRKDIDIAWGREAEDRLNAYERGKVRSSPANEVLREVVGYGLSD